MTLLVDRAVLDELSSVSMKITSLRMMQAPGGEWRIEAEISVPDEVVTRAMRQANARDPATAQHVRFGEGVMVRNARASEPAETRALVVPVTQPATRSAKEKHVGIRHVEVPLLGKTSDVKGVPWPDDPGERWRSRSVEEPSEFTVRLPGGKVLTMRTRPILIISRIMPTDVIGTIDAPPEGERGSLRDKAEEVERLLAGWQIAPDARIRADLDEWKQRDYPGTGVGGQLRIGVKPDERTWIGFRVNSGGPDKGGWHLVVEFEAEAEQMQRARVEATGASPPAATQQAD